MPIRICVIGAGPSGLALLRAFDAHRLEGNYEIIVFEKQATWGGMWNYDWRIGTDQNGETQHCSMYQHLWTNVPKEVSEMADYPFDEHFGHPVPSFLPRNTLRDWLLARAVKHQLDKKFAFRFNTAVSNVTFKEDTANFCVTVQQYQPELHNYTETFDYVVVASGHYSVPFYPSDSIPGIEDFKGPILHAHDLRCTDGLTDRSVLLIGSSFSAQDIACQLYKFGNRKVTICYNEHNSGVQWPEGIEELPMLLRIQADNQAVFENGEIRPVDVIIYCTGYKMQFPFLAESLQLKTDNSQQALWPEGLYKGVVWQQNPKLLYLGAQMLCFAWNFLDTQAWFARDVITGRVQLPDKQTREKDERIWLQRQVAIFFKLTKRLIKLSTLPFDIDLMIDYQTDHMHQLLSLSDYPKFDTKLCGETLKNWFHEHQTDVMGIRDRCSVSAVTSTLAAKPSKNWIDTFDDREEDFQRRT